MDLVHPVRSDTVGTDSLLCFPPRPFYNCSFRVVGYGRNDGGDLLWDRPSLDSIGRGLSLLYRFPHMSTCRRVLSYGL
jgi:hypothetical protein